MSNRPLRADSGARPLTIESAGASLRDRSMTAVELLETVTARADQLDGALGVYVTRTDEQARAAAERADHELARGIDRGPLHGIPLALKDIIVDGEAPTLAQSVCAAPLVEGLPVAPVVDRLRAGGAVLTGKVATMEFAIGMPDSAKPFAIPRNPYSLDHWPGGSSTGNASGVASGMFLGGLGTDTGGSIRVPASWCGISGLKPTYGRVPKSGVLPLGYSYDCVGPMARTARDCAAILTVIAGPDPWDPRSADAPVDDYLSRLDGDIRGVRVGVDMAHLEVPWADPSIHDLVASAIDQLRDLGAIIVPTGLPFRDELKAVTQLGASAEALAFHRQNLRRRWDDYGTATRLAILEAVAMTAADYVQLQRARRTGARAVAEIFSEIDVHLMPTTVTGALRLDEPTFERFIDVVNTPYWSAVGYPAISIPMGVVEGGLPVGLHLASPPMTEALLLKVADAFQQATQFHLMEPGMERRVSS